MLYILFSKNLYFSASVPRIIPFKLLTIWILMDDLPSDEILNGTDSSKENDSTLKSFNFFCCL